MIVIMHYVLVIYNVFFFFQAEDGIRDLVRSRGLGDVYKRQIQRLLARHHRSRSATSRLMMERCGTSPTGGIMPTLSLIHI